MPVLLVPINQYTTLMQVEIVCQSQPVSTQLPQDNQILSPMSVPRVTSAQLELATNTQTFAKKVPSGGPCRQHKLLIVAHVHQDIIARSKV